MLDRGTTEFVLAVPSVTERELRRLSSSLFDSWEDFVGDALSIPDYSLFLQVEEGSVKGLAKIGAVLGAVYLGIGNYGGFVSGIKTINEQVSATGDYLTEQANRVFSCPPSRSTSKRRGGSLAVLQRLFIRVQKGELTPEEAMIRAEKALGIDSSNEPEFMHKLADAFQHALATRNSSPFRLWSNTKNLTCRGSPRLFRPAQKGRQLPSWVLPSNCAWKSGVTLRRSAST